MSYSYTRLNYSFALINITNSFISSNFILGKVKDFYVIYIKVTRNNIFLTLTKNGSNVVLSLSGGHTSAKKKRATLTLYFLVMKALNYLQKHNIKCIDFLIIRSTWYRLANIVLAPLAKGRVVVQYISVDPITAHGSMRKRKLRRL